MRPQNKHEYTKEEVFIVLKYEYEDLDDMDKSTEYIIAWLTDIILALNVVSSIEGAHDIVMEFLLKEVKENK